MTARMLRELSRIAFNDATSWPAGQLAHHSVDPDDDERLYLLDLHERLDRAALVQGIVDGDEDEEEEAA